MNMRKQGVEPDEAPNPVNKRPRVQTNTQIDDPVPQPNLQESNVGSSFNRVPQAGSHQIPPIQLPPSVRARPVLQINPAELPDLPSPSQSGLTDPGSGRSEASTCYSQSVANYDVVKTVEPLGRVEEEDLLKWGKVDGAAEFIRSTSGLEGNWVGIRPLGKGGNGIAGLWEFRDDDGQPTKQMVIKEETYTKKEWIIPKARNVPDEVKTMSKLNKVGCYAITRLFNYKRYPNYRKHRMYMEFCEFKDLSVLCDRYRGFRQFLPEAFLWDTFYHLVEAAVAMRDGPSEGEWDFEIVHRDLKPGNVFLASANEEKGFPFYPVAKTGDFGLAVMTNSEDLFNPHDYQGPGTEGYYADEQFVSYRHLPREEQQRLSSHTNVWAIGATMFELLTLYAHTDYMNDKAYSRDGYIVDLTTVKDPEYSQELRDLIQDCLHPTPRNRIRLDILRISINEYRNRMRDAYEQSNDNKKSEFESDSLLYYVKNEINRMPPGNWEPYYKRKRPDDEKFPETARIRYPRFADGPEEDDGDDDEAGTPGGVKLRGTVPPPRLRRRRERQNVIRNDPAHKRTDDTAIRPLRRARRVPRPRLRRQNAMYESPDAEASDGHFGDGGWFVNPKNLHGRLGDLLKDDVPDDGANDDATNYNGTDAGSYSMDEEASDAPSPQLPPASNPPPPPPAPAPQPPIQIPALQPVVQTPAIQPPLQPATRTLRNGKAVPYF